MITAESDSHDIGTTMTGGRDNGIERESGRGGSQGGGGVREGDGRREIER